MGWKSCHRPVREEGLKARKIIAQGKASLRATPWVNRLTKDHVAGVEAAGCYTTAAEKLDAAGDWTFAVTSFKRALYLASRFGRNKPTFEDGAKTLVVAAKRAASNSDSFHCC